MPYLLSFDHLFNYDPSQSGISLTISLQTDSTLQIQEILCKVDTGSTFCVFQREYAEALGINLEEGLPLSIGTATNPFIAFGHEVNLLLKNYLVNTMVYFAKDIIPRNILGRHGFLDHFPISVVDYEGKLYLSQYNAFISNNETNIQPTSTKKLTKKK